MLGRRAEVDNNQIETLIKNNQCCTTWEIANILKISKLIKLLVKMRNMYYFTKKTHYVFGQPNKISHILGTPDRSEGQGEGALISITKFCV